MKFFFLVFFLQCHFISMTQQVPVSTQQQLEQLADTDETAITDDQLLQQLEYYARHPIQLNITTKEELQALQLLSEIQVYQFIQYRKLVGKLIDIHELQSIPGWDAILIQKILPYVTIHERLNLKENFLMRWKGEHSILVRASRILEKSIGYSTNTTNRYVGDRQHILLRYRYQFKDLLYMGITGDKDAGERFFSGAKSMGFDFYSFHFFMKRTGAVAALALGDYMVNMGQGLVSWQSTGFGKSGEVMAINRSSPVLNPYKGSGESGFYRGAGITVGRKKMKVTVFISRKRISGHVDDSLRFFTGINNSGYNRTYSELEQKNRIVQLTAGGQIAFASGPLLIGINTLLHRFNLPLLQKQAPYHLYSFSGQELKHLSIEWNYTYRNINFFGEFATDQTFQPAGIGGTLLSIDPKIDVSILVRKLPKNFKSLFGNAFSENTLPVNEQGIYAALTFRPAIAWQLSGYADVFSFPWLRFRVSAPSRGYDYLVQANYHPNKQVSIYLRYRNRNKPIDENYVTINRFVVAEEKQYVRFHLINKISSVITCKSRFEIVWYRNWQQNKEQGFLGFVEADGQVIKHIKAALRLQYFETESYNTRIYAYETDVLYGFSIPAFYKKGFRYLVNLQYSPGNKIGIWLRWAQTIFEGLHQVGSGNDTIPGKRESELKLQLRFLFS